MKKIKKIKSITCSECEKMIHSYIDNSLSISELEIIYNHIKNCPGCMEELTIQFLVTEGIEAVDKSDNYNLVKRLNQKLRETERVLHRNKISKIATAVFLALVCIAVILAIFVLNI